MALHTSLPIYKVTYDLLVLTNDFAKNMNKSHKRSIGEKLNGETMEMVVSIYRANVARDKSVHLAALVERLQVTELLLRLSCDMKLISKGQYAKAIVLTCDIGRQASGWRRPAASPAA